MPRRTSRLIGLLALLLALALLAPEVLQRRAVDACLDAGGSYDYALGACDQLHGHRPPSSWGASSWLAVGGALLAALAWWLLFRKGER